MDAITFLNILSKYGYEAYLVGGYPRDKYLNLINNDIDICTNATPEQLNFIFKEIDMSNAKFGNTRIYNFEITTFRIEEEYLDNRWPQKIQYVKTLEEDLIRRDFIINTLCIDKDNNYIDIYNARKDLDDKIIRTVGNSDKKIEEDSLRILRAVRFAVTLNFKLDIELIKSIKKYGYLVEKIPIKRKKEEIQKIISNNGIYLLNELNLTKYLKNLI